MSSQQKQPAAFLHTDPDHLASSRDLYRAGVRFTVPQAVIQLRPETIPLNVDDVESISEQSDELRDLTTGHTASALQVTLNKQGTDRLHKMLRARMPLPERAVWATAAMFVTSLVLPLMVMVRVWDMVAVCLIAIALGFVMRRLSINNAVARVDLDGEDYPSEGLHGVTHPAFGDIMVRLVKLAELQNISVLEHPFLSDLQAVASFVQDTSVAGISSQESAALHEEATQLIDTIAAKIDEEIVAITDIQERTQQELEALGSSSADELLAAGDEQVNEIKIAGIRDRAEMLRKSLDKDQPFYHLGGNDWTDVEDFPRQCKTGGRLVADPRRHR